MRLSGPTRTRAALALTASAALLVGLPAVSGASVDDTRLVPRSQFTMAADGSSGVSTVGAAIPNIDSVKATIRKYYGADASGHANRATSPYIDEMTSIEADALAALPTVDPAADKAVVFDADDTTLWTYDMEDGTLAPTDGKKGMHFIFDPVLQGTWVSNHWFPATPGMPAFVDAVEAKGYHVFGITGRGEAQEADTLVNLGDAGYTQFDADNFFTKFASSDTKPAYLDCHSSVDPLDDPAKCSTVEYKAGTRKHIEQDLGYEIALNVGDQFSDLQGGFSDASLKLPNPTYYLPSPNIAGAPASDADLTPRTDFTMAPDGSSGLAADGEGIPNIDSVKATIRSYYGADATGKADKDSSAYITELTALSNRWATRLRGICAKGVAAHTRPAVVFDADDTTLWTYDMEDAAMKFDFDPTLQNTWVQEGRFLPTPGMRKVVRVAASSGCKVVGITGRNNTQRLATLDNLNRYYTDNADNGLFKTRLYFTKWASTDQPPAYVDCAQDADPLKCSTIEYKSSTRKYVEDKLGLHIVANFGDQFSDLVGGHSDRTSKLPNPTYYLP